MPCTCPRHLHIAYDQEMALLELCEWIENTPLSVYIRESQYFFTVAESVHTLAILAFVSSIWMLDFRLMGWVLGGATVDQVKARILPWTWTAFLVAAISGGLVLWSEPTKCYKSPSFRIKMLLIVFAGLNALLFHRWKTTERRAGALSFGFWVAVIFFGRATGYDF